ncbi:MAG TPA: class I adenylate-forming enzyme family protein [Planctomycetota bacterium]|nr:class I adenylate-forming enzyme family protein [Planctomycetota bacterium]
MQLQDFLASSAARFPEKTAIVAAGERISYAELDRRSNRLAGALRDGGVRCGDRVAVCLENGIECAVSIFGALKADAAFVVMNPATKPDKVRFMLEDCAARAFIFGRQPDGAMEAAALSVGSVELLVSCGGGQPLAPSPRLLDFDRDLAAYPSEPPARQAIDMDLAALIYTSGSTGFPKGVTVTHLNMISAANSITQYLENVPEDVILNVLPLSFDYGLYQLLMAAKVGATLVLEKSFAFPFQIVQRVCEERVTGFPGVPTIFALLLQMKDLHGGRFDGVRYVTNTAAALPPAHILRLRSIFRKARIYSMYGITECKRVSYLPPDELDRRPTSVGRGMPNEQVTVVDEQGQPVPPGTVGELVVRGSNVMAGYWNRPEETARALRPGRYPWEKVLYTGDLFTADAEGYLYFVSRKDDIIKSRGEKVSPREVENAIYELPQVREAAVVGRPDPILGEAVIAYVVLAEGAVLSEREVLSHAACRLESHKVPKRLIFRESLPKTSTGKIRKAALREEWRLVAAEERKEA